MFDSVNGLVCKSCNQCPKAFWQNGTFEETYENTHMWESHSLEVDYNEDLYLIYIIDVH